MGLRIMIISTEGATMNWESMKVNPTNAAKATHGTEQSGSYMTARQIADIHLHRTAEEKCSHTHTIG